MVPIVDLEYENIMQKINAIAILYPLIAIII
jgi:hypothetical protein